IADPILAFVLRQPRRTLLPRLLFIILLWESSQLPTERLTSEDSRTDPALNGSISTRAPRVLASPLQVELATNMYQEIPISTSPRSSKEVCVFDIVFLIIGFLQALPNTMADFALTTRSWPSTKSLSKTSHMNMQSMC